MIPYLYVRRAMLSFFTVVLASSPTLSCNGQKASSPALSSQSSTKATVPRQGHGLNQPVSFTPSQVHRIEDPTYGVSYANVMIPDGWLFNGGVIHAHTCAITGPSPAFVLQSPNGEYGILVAPELTSMATNEAPVLAQMQQQGCKQNPSRSAADFARNFFLPHLGLENMKIESVGPAPELDTAARQMREQNQQLESQFPNTQFVQHRTSVDTAHVRVSFQAHGRPMEGQVNILIDCLDNRQSYPGMQAMQQHVCTAESLAFVFSPVGQSDFALKSPVYTFQMNPAWTERKRQEFNEQMAAQNQSNQNNMNAQTQRHNNQMAQQQQSYDQHNAQIAATQRGYDQANATERKRQNEVHESAQGFAGYIGDYNDYTNPATGQTVRASNQYNNTYTDSTGTVMLQTNQAGSPGVDWSMMVPRFK
jgi:hypothetical protein